MDKVLDELGIDYRVAPPRIAGQQVNLPEFVELVVDQPRYHIPLHPFKCEVIIMEAAISCLYNFLD